MTRGILRRYLADGTYQRLNASGTIANPDQRISEDVRAFTVTTLSFALMALNSAFTIVAFSGVLWSISPLLFGVAVLYAAIGSLFTFVFGRPLIKLNYDQLDKEASFRSALIDVRNNAEAIMTAREEDSQMAQLLSRLDDLVANFRKITSVNRNVGLFTTGYNWMIQIIPALIIAPAFIERKIEFGVITQSAVAFSNSRRRLLSHREPIPVAIELRRCCGAAERPRRGRRTVGRSPMGTGIAGSVTRPAECAPQLDVLSLQRALARKRRSGRPPRLPCRSERLTDSPLGPRFASAQAQAFLEDVKAEDRLASVVLCGTSCAPCSTAHGVIQHEC